MPTYERTTQEVTATRWFHQGDHPSVVEWYSGTAAEIKEMNRTQQCQGCLVGLGDHGLLTTPAGPQRVCPGDWIVMEVPGSYVDPLTTYRVTARMFEKHYRLTE